jgi:hypothetical protein
MINFIIALFVKKDLLSEEEGSKLSKAVFGRPIPDEYELALAFVERLLTEAKLSSTRKYFDPAIIEKKVEKKDTKLAVANKK